MDLNIYDDYNLVYAKNMGIAKRIKLDTKKEVVEFLLNNIDDIDFISINEVVIDKEKLIKENKFFHRYLKLLKINKIL